MADDNGPNESEPGDTLDLATLAGSPITLTFHDDEPHVVTTETVRRVADRLAAEQPDVIDAADRPHSPPNGRGLSRRLERGRRR